MVEDPVGYAAQEESASLGQSSGTDHDQVRVMLFGIFDHPIDGVTLE